MLTKDWNEQEKKLFSDGIEKIVEEIRNPEIKVISFDIFDTLLLRPVIMPADLFRLLENKLNIPNFHNLRIAAEAEARKTKSMHIQDITLNDIYDTYARLFRITDEEKERLKEEELQIEYSVLYERKSAKYLYEQARQAEKDIVIVSDMYLSSEFLGRVLNKNGYEGYKHIYVSSETGVLKSTRMMYQVVLSDLAIQGIKPNEVLHIGDNKRSDVECAIASGICAIHLPRPADKRNNCRHLKRMQDFILQDSLNSNNSMLYGVMLNLYFDDPFIDFHRSTFFNGDSRLLGYWFSPLMVGFTKWMIENVEKKKIEQLLWVWRDGYLPEKLFQMMRPYFARRIIESKKIYMGRDLRMPFSALQKNGFFNSFADNPINEKCTVDYFIKNRLLCEDDTSQYDEILNVFLKHGYLNKEAEIGKFERYRGFLNELEAYFMENAKRLIERYSKYIECNINKNKSVAIFDRSPRGKSSRFLEEFFSVKSVCFTTDVYDTRKAKLSDADSSLESYLEYGRYYINKMGCIWAQIFEILISDRAPGFKDVVDNLDGTYSVELNPVIQNDVILRTDIIVKEMQGAVVEFTEIVIKSLGNYITYLELDRHGLFDYTIEPLNAPHPKDAELIAQIYPGTSILSPIDENVFINWYNRKVGKTDKKGAKKKKPWDYIRHAGYVTAEKLGILWPARNLYRNIIGDPLEPIISIEKIQEVTNQQIDYINKLDFTKTNVIFTGSVPQEIGTYFNRLSKLNKGLYFVFIAAGFAKVPAWLDFPCIAGPSTFSFWGLDGQELKIKVPNEIKDDVYKKEYLKDLVKRRVLRGYSESVAIVLAYEAERYFSALLDRVKPVLVMTWNNWGNNSVVPSEIARRRGIPAISVERGFLEGTLMFSMEGYGKDLINLNPKDFLMLPVNHDELEEAHNVINFINNTKFNRYTQPVSNALEQLKQRVDNGKPNILLIGAFDCENPAFPQNNVSKRLYSPFFETSSEALSFVAKLAKRNEWNLLFKPHPLMDKLDQSKYKSETNVSVFNVRGIDVNGLIDLADVVVCMVSGVSYISLIRRKPLVALAYTPLKEKECCYEPIEKRDIEIKIKDALKKGYTKEQENAFIRHIAQVNKYYYFDDFSSRPIRYGRPIEEIGQILESLSKREGGIRGNESSSLGTYKAE